MTCGFATRNTHSLQHLVQGSFLFLSEKGYSCNLFWFCFHDKNKLILKDVGKTIMECDLKCYMNYIKTMISIMTILLLKTQGSDTIHR